MDEENKPSHVLNNASSHDKQASQSKRRNHLSVIDLQFRSTPCSTSRIRRVLLGILLLAAGLTVEAQTAFDKAVSACCLAVEALSDGVGSQTGMREAEDMLRSAKWSTLVLYRPDKKKDLDIGSHLVFNDKYFKALADGHKVKGLAKEYNADVRAGDGVRLCTKVLKAKQPTTYQLSCLGDCQLQVAAVAETNGLINMRVTYTNKATKETVEIPTDKKDEYQGAPYRLAQVSLPKGEYIITIEITNKYKKDRSCAIIVN